MPTPDDLAADLPEQTWKGRPIPDEGMTVAIQCLETRDGRTVTRKDVMEVDHVRVYEGVLHLYDGTSETVAELRADCLMDKWEYTPESLRRRQADRELGDMPEIKKLRAGEPLTEGDAAKLSVVLEMPITADVPNPFGEDDAPAQSDETPDAHDVSIPGLVRRELYLKATIEGLEAELKAANAEYAQVNATLTEKMSEEGMSQVTIDGMTGYFYPKTWVEKEPGTETEDVLSALENSGLGHMIYRTYSGSGLKALMAEYAKSKGKIPVPAPLAAILTLKQTSEVRFRQAGRSKIAS